jgi:phenylacetate-CoA ligase
MPDLAHSLYLRFPAFRDAAATLKGLQLKRERYGRHYREEMHAIRERDHWTAEQLFQYQSRRLHEIVQIAANHVPYYRNVFRAYGLSAADIQTPNDLQKLPILEKTVLRADPLKFVDERLDVRSLVEETTTGTTGVPTRVLISRQANQRNYAFLDGRCRRAAGFLYGKDRYVMFGAKQVVSHDRTRPPFWCYNGAAHQLYMSAFHLSPDYLEAYCRELKRRPYKVMMGYPSVMSTIARFVLDRKISDVRIPIAITNGETLQPAQRSAIEKAFGAEVFDQYGCAEMTIFAAERKCHRMHVSPDYGVTEIVDEAGNPCRPGQSGHLVCTGLVNDAQILLRCRVGDLAAWSPSPCDCGSGHPVLQALHGRASNAIVLPDGRSIFRVGTVAEEIQAVREYQIVQEEIARFVIYVVAPAGLSAEDRVELIRNLGNNVGQADIRVEVVKQLHRGPGGKFAFITSKVSPARPAPLEPANV